MSLPSLSIVIPTYNGLGHLQRCLPSVCRFAPLGTQVIVIDDASTDATSTWIARHFPAIDYHRLDSNQGFCRAASVGLTRATGAVVELLNNDTAVFAGWAEAALQHFADPRVGSVAPLAVQMAQPDRIDSAGQEFHICGWAYDRRHGRTVAPEDLAPRRVFGPSGSCGFYRSEALRQVGGLWPIYGAYFEDTDLAFRLRWAGYHSIYEPAAQIAHRGSASYGDQSPRHVYLISRNEEIVFWANLPTGKLLFGLVPHLGFLAVRCLRKLLGGQLKPFLAGKISALGRWREIHRHRRELAALRRTSGRRVDLALSMNARILRQGIDWLRHRRCA